MVCCSRVHTSGAAAGVEAAGATSDTPAKGFPLAAGAVREMPAKGLLAAAGVAAVVAGPASAPGSAASGGGGALGATAAAAPRRALKMRRCFSVPSSARLNSPATTCACEHMS